MKTIWKRLWRCLFPKPAYTTNAGLTPEQIGKMVTGFRPIPGNAVSDAKIGGLNMSDAIRGTLNDGEPHPIAQSALKYVQALTMKEMTVWQEAFASCGIEGNRLGEVCSETLNRIQSGQPVSDRYLLGLAWTIAHGFKDEKAKLKSSHTDGIRDAIAYLHMLAERERGGSPERIALFKAADIIEHDLLGRVRNRLQAFQDLKESDIQQKQKTEKTG